MLGLNADQGNDTTDEQGNHRHRFADYSSSRTPIVSSTTRRSA
jgi:hypothetical protein